MSIKTEQKTLRGDTLVEVMFSIGIFALVAISVSTLMNSMLGRSQASIEIVMARSEIDAQAEAIRFVHSAYKDDKMTTVWKKIAEKAASGTVFDDSIYPMTENITSCEALNDNNQAFKKYAFYIDTFKLSSNNPDDIFKTNTNVASIFPRIIHTDIEDNISKNYFDETDPSAARAEGIWVIAVKNTESNPDYYDFYIQTCWNSLGGSMPTTITTIFRLNNPEAIK